jgi:hypothetical protein
MSASDVERLARLEAEMLSVRGDVGEIKASLKSLERIAAQGGGAFHTILIIGGFLGWLVGMGASFYAMFRH